jgi:DNA-binding YbaB/EbfC family protein
MDMRQMQQLVAQAQQKAQELQKQMATTVVEASVGGGSVTVRMNGQKQLLSIRIDPEAVRSGDVEMLQDLVTAAVNEANRKVEDAMQASVGGLLGKMGLGM